jgi:sporulation protein YlmC with PRC-barrel domain
MRRTHASTLALAAALAAGTAGGAFAQDTTEEAVEGEAVIVEEEAAEDDAVVVEGEEAEDTGIVTDPAEEVEDIEGEAVVVEDAEVEEVEVEEVEVETPVEGQIFEQSPEEVLGSTLMDATVMSPDGEVVGDVEDVIVGPDGQIAGVVIGVGGFLGIGEKRVALEYGQIQVQQDELGEMTFMTSVSQDELENAPAFQTLAETQADIVEPGETATGDSEAIVDTEEPAVEGEAVVVE